jgi:peptide/nickel transport system substrate-binding protein
MRAVAVEELPVAPTKGVQTTRDSITIGASQEPADLTIFNNASINARIRSLIEDGLVGRDDNGNLFPLNAWCVPTLENGGARFLGEGEDRYLQVKYKIRPGIKWSDGVELTSKDAIFAYKLMMDPNSPVVSRAEQQRLQNVDNPDKYTVIYNYKTLPQAREFYDKLSSFEIEYHDFIKIFLDTGKPVVSRNYAEIGIILPEHALALIPPEQIQESAFARKGLGTGPWKVESWVIGQDIRLVPNEHYNLTGKPAIKRIDIRFVTDVARLTEMARTGTLDMVTSEAFVIPPVGTNALRAAGVETISRPGTILEMLVFNFEYGPFKEKAVREAIITGINRQRIVDQALGGTGRAPNSIVPSSLYFSFDYPGFSSLYPGIASRYKLPSYSYDPTRAAKLLDDAGWKLGPDGIRVKNGEKLQFIYATTINAVRQRVQELVRNDLRVIGVDTITKSYPSVFCDFYPCGPFYEGQIAQYVSNWSGGPWSSGPDFDEWTCAELYDRRTNSGLNRQNYCNPALDRVNVEFKTEALLEPQVSAAAEAQVIMMQDLPVVPLYERPIIELVTNKLVNYKLPNIANAHSSFWNARQWYFR